jgi:hypothetical protein
MGRCARGVQVGGCVLFGGREGGSEGPPVCGGLTNSISALPRRQRFGSCLETPRSLMHS